MAKLERLEATRVVAMEQARKHVCSMYVRIRLDGAVFFASVTPEGLTMLSPDACLYYEIWGPDGQLEEAVLGHAEALREYMRQQGVSDLQLWDKPRGFDGLPFTLAVQPLPSDIWKSVKAGTTSSGKAQSPASVSLSGSWGVPVDPAPLWWEVEQARVREQQEALIELRRSLRSMLNYD